jgi:homoserine kinase
VLARAVGSGTDADEAISAAFGGAMGGWRILPLAVDRAGATVEPSTR